MADKWLTFDCYGTVADWNSGMGGALADLAGVSQPDAGRLLSAYHQAELEAMERSIATIRSRLRARPLRLGDAEQRSSFSFGLARFPEDGADLDALVAVADKRLYAMKSAQP